MIDQDKRQAIYYLHNEGMSLREIARSMRVSVNSVTAIIRQQGLMPETTRKDKITVDEALLRKVYKDCKGFKQRIHEILTEEYGISIGYSTYRVTDIEAIKRIAALQIRQGNWEIQSPVVDKTYRNRKSYLDGQFVDDIDLSIYDEEGSHG